MSPPRRKKELTELQNLFVDAFLLLGRGEAAAARIQMDPKHAWKLLHQQQYAHVQDEILRRQVERAARARLDQDAVIREMEDTYWHARSIEDLRAAGTVLGHLARAHGLCLTKVEHSGKLTVADIMREAAAEEEAAGEE